MPLRNVSHPLIVEFAGMPGAGKTTTIDILDHYFRHNGYRVHVISEGARSCPLDQQMRVEFAGWTAHRIINLLLEEALSNGSHDLVLVDRGIFDAQVFARLLLAERIVDAKYGQAIIEYVSLDQWVRCLSIVFLLDVSADESWRRYEASRLHEKLGPIMNPDTLNLLHKCYEEAEDSYRSKTSEVLILPIHATMFSHLQLAEKCKDEIEKLLVPDKR